MIDYFNTQIKPLNDKLALLLDGKTSHTIDVDYTPSEHRPIGIVKSYSGGVYTKDVKIKPRTELYVQWDYVEEEV
jgi:hypothetical protein